MLGLIVSMEAGEGMSLDQIGGFGRDAESVRFEGRHRTDMYEWVTRTLREQRYEQRGRADKGLIRGDVAKVTG